MNIKKHRNSYIDQIEGHMNIMKISLFTEDLSLVQRIEKKRVIFVLYEYIKTFHAHTKLKLRFGMN